MPDPEKLYRYEAHRHSVTIDAEMEVYGISKPLLRLEEYEVVSRTPKGFWISYFFGGKDRWVSDSARKRFAYPTKEEALEAYVHRKKARIRHLENSLTLAEEDLRLAENKEQETTSWGCNIIADPAIFS